MTQADDEGGAEDAATEILDILTAHVADHDDKSEGLRCAGGVLQEVISEFLDMFDDIGDLYPLAVWLHEAVSLGTLRASDRINEAETQGPQVGSEGVH